MYSISVLLNILESLHCAGGLFIAAESFFPELAHQELSPGAFLQILNRFWGELQLQRHAVQQQILQRVLDTVERGAQANPLAGLAALLQAAPSPADNGAVENDLDTAMDFINGL